MLFGKKKKISKYLSTKQTADNLSPFDIILSDYLSGSLDLKMCQLSVKRITIHIDWLADYKCINIQGTVDDYYLDIQIEPFSFSVAYDKAESDVATEYLLKSPADFYKKTETIIQNIILNNEAHDYNANTDPKPIEVFTNSENTKSVELYYKNDTFTYTVFEKLSDNYEGSVIYYWCPTSQTASFFDTKEKAIAEIKSIIEAEE